MKVPKYFLDMDCFTNELRENIVQIMYNVMQLNYISPYKIENVRHHTNKFIDSLENVNFKQKKQDYYRVEDRLYIGVHQIFAESKKHNENFLNVRFVDCTGFRLPLTLPYHVEKTYLFIPNHLLFQDEITLRVMGMDTNTKNKFNSILNDILNSNDSLEDISLHIKQKFSNVTVLDGGKLKLPFPEERVYLALNNVCVGHIVLEP